jgi:hypothetical protein
MQDYMNRRRRNLAQYGRALARSNGGGGGNALGLLLEGDAQSGSDFILLEGDEQTGGSDILETEGL